MMLRKIIMSTALAASAAMAIAPTVANAHDYDGRGYYREHRDDDDRGYRRHGEWRGDRGYRGYGYAAPYGGYYAGNEGYRDRGYYRRESYRCRNDGTAGTVIGAIAGGLIGNNVAGRGDRAAGTIIGGGLGALAGNAIGRDC
nr:glycine zipper 2TM domain-containing protein [Sphingomonas sp. YR710]